MSGRKKTKKVPSKWSKYSRKKRKEALGNFIEEEKIGNIPFFLAESRFFQPITEETIQSGDWLEEFNDKHQPFRKLTYFNKLTEERSVIYILPIDEDVMMSSFFSKLLTFISRFFCLEVKVLNPSNIPKYKRKMKGVHTRKIKRCKENRDGLQYFVPDLNTLMKEVLPEDGYCVLGVTSVDIYHREDWEYVFGKATTKGRVGVISYCRYSKPKRLMLKRIIDVATHEILHMFGLQHCTYYRCVMNGANDLEEQDRRKQELCPICLRKMKKVIGEFDIQRRYDNLIGFYKKNRDVYDELIKTMVERMKFVLELKGKSREEYRIIFERLEC